MSTAGKIRENISTLRWHDRIFERNHQEICGNLEAVRASRWWQTARRRRLLRLSNELLAANVRLNQLSVALLAENTRLLAQLAGEQGITP